MIYGMRCFLLLFCLLFLVPLSAQQRDTSALTPIVVASDSTKSKTGFFSKNYPNPRRAALLGIFPGGGQAYNKRWWKLPIVYGGLGVAAWFLNDNSKTYNELKDNYKLVVDGDPETNPADERYKNLSPTALKTYRDQYKKYTEFSYLGLGLTYLLSITEAYVDAHLSRFDVSDDLSMQFKPSIQPAWSGSIALGMGISLQF
jgi:Family of unknown function (DUF5683)